MKQHLLKQFKEGEHYSFNFQVSMNNTSKTNKVTKQFLNDIKHEVLGTQEGKKEIKPGEPKRSALDIMLNKYPTPPVDNRPSPIVEAMLQTREDEAAMKQGKQPSRLDAEMAQLRARRAQEMQRWHELQQQLMAKPVTQENSSAALPPSAPKGNKGPGHKAAGMESFKRGKKN